MNLGAFTGRLGHTPELRDAAGTPVVNVNIAVSCFRKGEESTLWVPCVFFGRTAETLAKYRGKGDEIGVSGRWEPHTWTGKDGTEKNEARLIVGDLTLTNGRTRANSEASGSGGTSEPGQFPAGDDGGGPPDDSADDIPF